MPQYQCPTCQGVIDFPRKITPGETRTCLNCKRGQITSAHKIGSLNAPPPRKTKRTIPTIQGRPVSAPLRTTWPGTNLNNRVTHVQDLSDAAWTGAKASRICLAYKQLDISRAQQVEGIVITCPQAKKMAAVKAHFGAIKRIVESPKNNEQLSDVTGEAAAALCVLSTHRFYKGPVSLTLAGFQLVWGRHVHAGGGIDQIWKRTNASNSINQYLLVEAKGPGPGATLLPSPMHAPNDFDQMGIRWVMHNLGKMRNNNKQSALDIITDLGLTMGHRWPTFGGSSTNYYGVMQVGTGTGELYGVVVKAVWQPDGMLSYTWSDFQQYTDFAY